MKLALTEIPKTGFLATRIKIAALICPAAEAFSNTRYILQSSLSVCDSILMSCGVNDIDSIVLVNKQSKLVK